MSELPLGWSEATLGDVIDGFETGRNIRASPTPAKDGQLGVLKLSAVTWGKFQPTENKALLPGDWPRPHETVRAGDLLISRANTSELVGAPVLVPADHPHLMLPDKILRVLYDSAAVDARYLLHALRARPARTYIEASASGTSDSMRNLSQPKLRDTPVVLAPRAEQKRIADKLDALFARVEACRTRLDRVPAFLKRFRLAVLNAATNGELSGEWRGTGIESWSTERAADVCAKVQSGGTPKEGFSATGIPFLKVYNIVDQQVAFEYKPQYIEPSVHKGSMRKSVVYPGDVLMNIVGPPLGKVAVVPTSSSEWNINQAITLFRPGPRVSTGWLYCVLRSGKNIADIVHETRGSAGQVNISLSQCRDFALPVPPLEEQTEIVRRVDSLFALADSIEAKVRSARAQVDRLTPALLAKAFQGELVPQDPTDEPAAKLLKRIATTKVALGPKGKRPRVLPRSAELKSETKRKLRDLIKDMPEELFTFEDLRRAANGDYESIKDELFALLRDNSSGVEQFFDANAKAMKLRQARK